ncbi:hypothetical protein K458DRAFT_394501 [Lentithecium fluviatile CBS 122367]|uniref:Uncharacterized protein n=1 Tax=Lentithecium fluviatile CBS 122367 TaxID=1168545 RepID=A0A6G1ILV5_9PLEO|nr:hypothetical protein K458DRAFT_394501 [Lentithecium fluviatile CBS 122367]
MNKIVIDGELVERMEHLRFREEVVEHRISITEEDARLALAGVYELLADQTLDPVALGVEPVSPTDTCTPLSTFAERNNSFYAIISRIFSSKPPLPSKSAIKVSRLEEQLLALLDLELRIYILRHYKSALVEFGANLKHNSGVRNAIDTTFGVFEPVRVPEQMGNTTSRILIILMALMSPPASRKEPRAAKDLS